MKGKLFRIGQAVTPNKSFSYSRTIGISSNEPEIERVPQFGKVYHISEYQWHGKWYVGLIEFPSADGVYLYAETGFSPLISDSLLAEELSEIFSDGIVVLK